MVEVRALCKSWGPRPALRDVGFAIGSGEIVGILGPNGAGKTTTMRILTGYLAATSGKVRVAGHDVLDDPDAVKRHVGYLPETPPLYPELTVGQSLRFVAELRGYDRRARVLAAGTAMERVGLGGWEDRRVGTLSKGYRQRVGIAQAILHAPPVLILDEPTSGLDPAQVGEIRALIRALAGSHTVLLSTHVLAEVEAMCPRAVVLAAGRVRADGPLDALRAATGDGGWVEAEVRGVAPRVLGEVPGVAWVEPGEADADGWIPLRMKAADPARPSIAAAVQVAGGQLRALRWCLPSLQDTFLSLTRDP
jgi:ABC-2 type transport system ATP-binding protein